MTSLQRARHKLGNAVRFSFKVGLVIRTPAGLRQAQAVNQAQRGAVARLMRCFRRLAR